MDTGGLPPHRARAGFGTFGVKITPYYSPTSLRSIEREATVSLSFFVSLNQFIMNLSKMNVLVEATRLAIHNTENNTAVKQQMAAYGLSPAELQTGKNRLRTLEQEHERQMQLQDERWSLARQMEASMQAVVSTFKTHVRLARSAFRDDLDLLHSLRAERFDARPWECVQQAAHFYRVFQSRQLSLENLGVSAKEIQQAQRAVAELQRMKEARADKKGLAEQSTVARQQAQKELRTWLVNFRAIARIAFREQPQLLERFGMKVVTTV